MKIGTAFHSKILLHFHSPPSTPPRKYSPVSFHQPIFSFHHTNLNLRAGLYLILFKFILISSYTTDKPIFYSIVVDHQKGKNHELLQNCTVKTEEKICFLKKVCFFFFCSVPIRVLVRRGRSTGRRNLVLCSQNLDFKVEEELMDLKKDSLELNRSLYPAIEPYSTGFLKVSDLHSIYWEQSGNPSGHPVVFLHGGPGGGTSPSNRRFFDPEFYRIILFDQRGAGKSTPHACLEENTTWDLVADIEKLREHLEIPEWQVFGGSWGSTLALAYSQSHPEKVTGLVLRGIFLLRKKEIDWFYEGGAAAIFPDAWEPFRDLIPENERSCLVEAYHKRLNSDDPETQNAAAKAWTKWEMMTAHLLPNEENVKRGDDDSFSLAFARIENHYFINKGFFPSDSFLLDNLEKIKHIKTMIVQGRYDVCCPMMSAWDLHKAWPEAELTVVRDAGHSANEPGIAAELVAANEKLKNILKGIA